jgi:hypothetical protein
LSFRAVRWALRHRPRKQRRIPSRPTLGPGESGTVMSNIESASTRQAAPAELGITDTGGNASGNLPQASAGELRQAIGFAIDKLANEPHDQIIGLKRRYYYRGGFVLLEKLTPRGLAKNVERLRRRGESEQAARLVAAWLAVKDSINTQKSQGAWS